MESIPTALGSIHAIVWGERALVALGVRCVCEHYMLVIEDDDFEAAERQLRDYAYLDQNSTRFFLPLEPQSTAKVALLPSSYTHIRIRPTSKKALARDNNLYYPDAPTFLQSFVQTLVREPVMGRWESTLGVWAIAYAYGDLMINDDVLDGCEDEKAKTWFNENIQRFSGGIDRVTCTKRLGRVGYDESLARKP